jgi:replicative DNA helicase
MATIERMLNVKIIRYGGLKEVLEWGITEEDFLLTSERQIFAGLVANYMSPDSSGSTMGVGLASIQFPQLDLTDTDPNVTIGHLCNEVRKNRVGHIILNKVKEINLTAAAGLAYEAASMLNELQFEVSSLQLGRSTDVTFKRGVMKVKERYNKMKSGDVVGIMPWPWKPLQEQTKGLQEDDYIVFYGRPKSKKTWLLVYLIYWAILHGKRVLFYTKEMTDTNLYMRIAACCLKIHYNDLRLGQMAVEKEAEFFELEYTADSLEKDKSVICLSAQDAGGHDSVAWLRSKVEKYKPDVVFIDGIYLMSVDKKTLKDNERVALISRQIRQMILQTRVPVVATIQANRKAAGHAEANLDEIAFSDALSQDCTIAARVIKSKDEVPQTISIVMGGLREFDMVGFKILGIPCTNFSYQCMLTEEVLKQEMKADDDTEVPKKKWQLDKPKATEPKNGNGKSNSKKANSPPPIDKVLNTIRQKNLEKNIP